MIIQFNCRNKQVTRNRYIGVNIGNSCRFINGKVIVGNTGHNLVGGAIERGGTQRWRKGTTGIIVVLSDV